MRRFFIHCFLLLFAFTGYAQRVSIEDKLKSIPDITFKKIESPHGFKSAYEIQVKQPLEHNNPASGDFFQKIYLSHLDFSKPLVFVTEGYECNSNRIYELTQLIGANQIEVEHRFFGTSIPDSADYTFLSLKQATADLHRIKEIFKEIYREDWISTGISKGGQTTLFYKYFYPNDVEVSVPYVAPFNLSLEDKRIYDFLDTVGSAECRKKISDFQKLVFVKRDSLLPIMKNYSYETGLEFTYLTLEQAFEYTVLEYSFSFWQWGHNCSAIPGGGSTLRQIYNHLLSVSNIGFFSDSEMKAYGSHYYQAATEMGYYGYDVGEFDTLIKALPGDRNSLATFSPDKIPTAFDSSLVYKAFNWLEINGNNIIYIYGASDTWSATAVPPSNKTNAVWFFLKGKNHGDARIANMSEQEQIKLESALENWLEIDVDLSRISAKNSKISIE